jgi:hypothetical protein
MPDRWLSNEDWEAMQRLKEWNDHFWLELGDAPALTDAHVAEMRAIHEELSRILGRYAAADSAPVA